MNKYNNTSNFQATNAKSICNVFKTCTSAMQKGNVVLLARLSWKDFDRQIEFCFTIDQVN